METTLDTARAGVRGVLSLARHITVDTRPDTRLIATGPGSADESSMGQSGCTQQVRLAGLTSSAALLHLPPDSVQCVVVVVRLP